MIIYKAVPEVFINDDMNQQISMFSPYDENDPKKFIASIIVTMQNGRTQEFPFEIKASTLEEAFIKYDDAYEAEMEKLKSEYEAQVNQSKIIAPNKDIII